MSGKVSDELRSIRRAALAGAEKAFPAAASRQGDRMMLTEEQFVEIVEEAMQRHISRDTTVCAEDQADETRAFSAALTHRLRVNGINAPRVEMPVPVGARP